MSWSEVEVHITTSDFKEVVALHFKPDGFIPRGHILMAGATAVPQRYYREFAIFLVENGFSVMTFDYRGVGLSAKTSASKSFDFYDWSQKDYSSVFEYCLKLHPKMGVVGHSFGALCFGIHSETNSSLGMYAFGAGSGGRKYLSLIEKLKSDFLWFVVGPLVLKLYGYVPKKFVGMGAHLPKKLFKQWRSFYWKGEFWFQDKANDLTKDFELVRKPIKVVNSFDDPWTSIASAKEYFKFLPHADIEFFEEPGRGEPIGHMGYFRRDVGGPLWDSVVNWFSSQMESV